MRSIDREMKKMKGSEAVAEDLRGNTEKEAKDICHVPSLQHRQDMVCDPQTISYMLTEFY